MLNTRHTLLEYEKRLALLLCLTSLLAACGAVSEEASLTSQALPGGAAACLYENSNYGGASLCVRANNQRFTTWDNRVSSARVEPGQQLELFDSAKFTGRTLKLAANTPSLASRNFDNLTSSFKLSKAETTPPPPTSTDLDAKCTPKVTLVREDTNAARLRLFLDVAGKDPKTFLQDIGRKVCRTLYRKASEVRDASAFELILRYAPGDVAWKSGDGSDITVMISTDHLNNVKRGGRDVGEEVKGILFHEMTHMYQQDDSDRGGADIGVIEGIADFVRFKNGFTPDDAQPDKNGRWNDGYRTTAFFLLWLDARYRDAVYKLNLSMDSRDGKRWTPESFRAITGKTVDQLWRAYRNAPN